MATKGKTYYREKTKYPPLFKQIITVLSDPRVDVIGQKLIKVERISIDYSGIEKEVREFGDFPDEGLKEEDEIIKPIEDVGHKELKDFFFVIFENKKYTGK